MSTLAARPVRVLGEKLGDVVIIGFRSSYSLYTVYLTGGTILYINVYIYSAVCDHTSTRRCTQKNFKKLKLLKAERAKGCQLHTVGT